MYISFGGGYNLRWHQYSTRTSTHHLWSVRGGAGAAEAAEAEAAHVSNIFMDSLA